MALINGIYMRGGDGTASFSRAIAECTPGENRVLRARRVSTDSSRRSFWRKTLFELTIAARTSDLVIHPYFAASMSRSAAIVIHDDVTSTPAWHQALVERSARRAGYVATVSNYSKDRLERKYGRQFSVLTQYPQLEFWAEPSKASRRPSDVISVGYWGGWHPRKGMAALLRTHKPSPRIRFWCTGSPPRTFARGATWRPSGS